MQRHCDIRVPLACPHCRAELLPTLNQIHEAERISCDRCGTEINLRPEHLPVPGLQPPASTHFYFPV